MHRCQLDVTSSLPLPGLHVTSVFRSTKELNTFYFLLKGHVSVKEVLLETVSPGEEHPRMQAARLPGRTQLLPGSPQPGDPLAAQELRAAARRVQAGAGLPSSQRVKRAPTPLAGVFVAGRAPLSPAQEQIKALGIYLLAGCGTLALSDRAFHPC